MSVHEAISQATSGQAIDLSSADYDISGKLSMRGILVGVAGNVVGRLTHDAADVTYPLQAGEHPLRFVIIRKTGTTATGLVALF
jgi:hypothetical protein